MSGYEERIIEILQRDKLKFQREKRFNDLQKGRYRFDFEVYVEGAPVLIEVQGEQHYQRIDKFHHNRADFESAKERDRRKISYCLAHRIPLYIIPYWEINNLRSASDIFQEKFRARNRWKNDLNWQHYQNLTNCQQN